MKRVAMMDEVGVTGRSSNRQRAHLFRQSPGTPQTRPRLHPGLSIRASVLVFSVFLCGATLKEGEKNGEAFEALRDAVLGQIERNRSRLKRCHIVWTHRIMENGFVEGRSGTLESQYELWFDSGKIAVKCREEVREEDDERAWNVSTTAFRSVFSSTARTSEDSK